jgi:anti-sigma factor RsiW
MTCREISEFLLEYSSGELDAAVRADFDSHIAACGNCLVFLRQYRATILAGQTAFQDPADSAGDEIPEELVRAILDLLHRTP